MKKKLDSIKTIFWDFDGVLMNSNEIRTLGFERVLKEYPVNELLQLIRFHQENGGLSRYVKFKYFFEVIRSEKLSEKKLAELIHQFSIIMREELVNPQLLIDETVNYINKEQLNYNMHIVSGSDQAELRFICNSLNIESLFQSICGSPTPKTELIADVINRHGYKASECMIIGDSINDYQAAIENNIYFVSYNNSSLDHLSEEGINLF